MLYIVYGFSILVILYYIGKIHKNAMHDAFFKTLASLSFVLTACVVITKGGDSYYATWMFLGLVLGAMGDVLLALPFCYPKKKDAFFLGGLGAFALGHLSYAYALYQTNAVWTMIIVICSILGGIGMIVFLQKLHIDFQHMVVPSILYAMIILFMEGQALSYLFEDVTAYGVLLNVGTLAFVLSDLVLVFILFGNKQTRRMTRSNLMLYYFAQMSLLSTLLMR